MQMYHMIGIRFTLPRATFKGNVMMTGSNKGAVPRNITKSTHQISKETNSRPVNVTTVISFM